MEKHPTPDWAHWLATYYWSFAETACLIHSIDPTDNSVKFPLTRDAVDRGIPTYRAFHFLSNIPPTFTKNLERGEMDGRRWSRPEQLAYLEELGFEIPEPLLELLPKKKKAPDAPKAITKVVKTVRHFGKQYIREHPKPDKQEMIDYIKQEFPRLFKNRQEYPFSDEWLWKDNLGEGYGEPKIRPDRPAGRPKAAK